jgi:LysR family transcriptional regulator (chromosome initiation inhibitor)
MLDRQQLETFAAVVEHQSFERAAGFLNVTRGAVSQRIRALEERLCTVLLLREKPLLPTRDGEAVLKHVKMLRLMEEGTLREVSSFPDGLPAVPVSIAVNADSLATWFEPIAWQLIQEQRIALEVIADDQDHTSGLLARGGVMGCISTAPKAATGFVAERLGAMIYKCVAHPVFAHQHFSDGFQLASVLAAPAILFNRKDSLHDLFLECVFGFRVEKYTKHYFPSPVALLDAIRAGVGYGLVPLKQAKQFLVSGELIELTAQNEVTVDLYWHHWEVEPPPAAAISRLIIDEAKKRLNSPSEEGL